MLVVSEHFNIAENDFGAKKCACGKRVLLTAHLHNWRRTQVRTRIRIPKLIATLYCTETVHIAQIWTRIPTPYFCRGQEPESVSGNVNEPLQMGSF